MEVGDEGIRTLFIVLRCKRFLRYEAQDHFTESDNAITSVT